MLLNQQQRILRVLITALACVSVSAMAGPTLTPHTAEYKVKISVLGGKLRTQFQTTESGYFAESVIQATGMSRISCW